jgi:predicted nucleic-acid-binding protein
LDTNIVLRLILNDDPEQSGIARALLSQPASVGTGVLMETAWVLKKTYEYPRQLIAAALDALIEIPTIYVSDEAGVRWAIERYRAHGADFADMLHLVAARGSSSFASFEKRLADRAGSATPVQVELPS